MTFEETETLIERIKAAWPSFRQNEWTPREWHKSLLRFTMSQIDMAFDKIKLSSKYAPSIADFFACLEAQGVTRYQSPDNSPTHVLYDGRRPFYIREHGSDKGRWIYAGYEALENLVKYDGIYMRKVEYLCEIFGGAKVTELYKEWAEEHKLIGVKSLARAVKNEKFPVEQYKQFLNDMMALADSEAEKQNIQRDYAPNWIN
jgi:hypothetical protein